MVFLTWDVTLVKVQKTSREAFTLRQTSLTTSIGFNRLDGHWTALSLSRQSVQPNNYTSLSGTYSLSHLFNAPLAELYTLGLGKCKVLSLLFHFYKPTETHLQEECFSDFALSLNAPYINNLNALVSSCFWYACGHEYLYRRSNPY